MGGKPLINSALCNLYIIICSLSHWRYATTLYLQRFPGLLFWMLHLIVAGTGEFQGPALVAVLEGAILSREEISSLQLLPPWRLRGDILNYGLGLLSCYFICDFLSIVSGGYYYMFDPRGLALAISSSHSPSAKEFSLLGISFTHLHWILDFSNVLILIAFSGKFFCTSF